MKEYLVHCPCCGYEYVVDPDSLPKNNIDMCPKCFYDLFDIYEIEKGGND